MKRSVSELFRIFLGDIRTLLRQEFQLARTELSEKASRLGKSGLVLALGGSAAYAGVIVLLMGFGLLLAWAFSIAGMPALLAGFLGLVVMGALVACAGAFVLFKAVHTLSQVSLVPEKSVETLQHLKGTPPHPSEIRHTSAAPEAKLSANELQALAFATEDTLGKTVNELDQRLNPRHMAERMNQRISSHPYRAGLIAFCVSVAGGLLAGRKLRHA